ncbi:MAG: alpha/beta fold hydrolase [Chloroflexi bacterium]|nr:alpha/beta fold hydrolase [Chloroflexota bacterium]MCI0818245.1 alpha/beta fold hydrolase [Chloroflexota bacterium]MCI0842360.1 alpha/beta fold hydrolase [Chloroflexota bacterium]
MEQPRIQYAQTEDDVNIAYWTLGEGEPLVHLPWAHISHLELDWLYPDYRRWYERLADRRQLIRYDGRGTGLSDREGVDSSLDNSIRDLEAVVDRLGLERFALMGLVHSGLTAVAFAARHADRVSRLVLWCSYASPSDYYDTSPKLQSLRAVAEKDWDTFLELSANLTLGWSEGEQARRFAEYMRECFTQNFARETYRGIAESDVTDLLPQLEAPTLVLHRREVAFPTVDNARALASRIPNAQLILQEGTALVPFLGDTEAVAEAINEFLGEGKEAAAIAEPAEPGTFRTVLFTDLVAHTEMMSRLGDERGRDVLREHETITRDVLKQHAGTEVKTMGDGFMASFSSVTKAVECSIALQRALAERKSDEPLNVRVGLNAGEPIEEDGDLFGATVILASRIAAKADGGEILVADTIRGLCSGKGFLFADRGEFVAKGFEEPVRLYEVRWRD